MKVLARLFHAICSRPRVVVGFCTAVGILFATQVPNLAIDLSLEQRFVGGDGAIETYDDFRETFGSEPSLAVMIRSHEGSVWDAAQYERIAALTEELSRVAGIERATSIGSIPGLDADTALLRKLPLVRKLMVGIHDDAALVLLEPASSALAPRDGMALTMSVEEVVERHAHPSWTLGVMGPLWLQSEAIRYSRFDLKVMSAIAFIGILLILGLALRSMRATVGPLLVAVITVAITLGTLAVAGVALSQFALIAVPVLVGLAVLDGVHIVHAWRECDCHPERSVAKSRDSSLLKARDSSTHSLRSFGRNDIRNVFSKELHPCLWTSLTTLIGFVVLVLSPIAQVRSIGLVIAIGVPVSFVLSFTFLPSFLSLGKGAGRGCAMWDPFPRWAAKLASFVERRSRSIVVGFIAFAVIASAGIALLHIDLDFPQLFRKRSRAQVLMEEADRRFGSAASLELMLEARHPQGFADPETLRYAANLAQAVSLSFNVAGTVSFLDAGLSSLIAQGVDLKGLRLDDGMVVKLIDEVRNDARARALLAPWITDDFRKARVHVKLQTRNPEQFALLDAALAKMNVGFGSLFSVTPTGFAYLYKSMERVMMESFLTTFGCALIGVILALFLLARSWRLGMAAALANLLPLGIVLGLMGWMGVGISVGLVILPAVGLGLIADDTVHLIMALRREGGEGKAAVEGALRSSGWPIVMTQLILLAAFGSLIASHFSSTVTLGIYMTVLLIFGLAFDLLFVPALILLLLKKPSDKSPAAC